MHGVCESGVCDVVGRGFLIRVHHFPSSHIPASHNSSPSLYNMAFNVTRWSICLLVLLSILPSVFGLYFYLEGSEQKCFTEELPKETMVTGIAGPSPGIYFQHH